LKSRTSASSVRNIPASKPAHLGSFQLSALDAKWRPELTTTTRLGSGSCCPSGPFKGRRAW